MSNWLSGSPRKQKNKDVQKVMDDSSLDYESDSSTYADGFPSIKAVIIGKLGACFLPKDQDEVELLNTGRYIRNTLDTKAKSEVEGTPNMRMPPLGMSIPENPISEQSIARANKWLKVCSETHPLCDQGNITRQMPTRLIDVTLEDSKDTRLILTTKGDDYKYTALSHSWGGHVALTTTRETLEQRKAKIKMEEFPLTFRDAVTVTRNLNIRYYGLILFVSFKGMKMIGNRRPPLWEISTKIPSLPSQLQQLRIRRKDFCIHGLLDFSLLKSFMPQAVILIWSVNFY